MVFDADTGKLTVPGLIDPTGMVFDEAALPPTGGAKGAIFVSDGTGGLVANTLYYVDAAGNPIDISSGSGGGTLQDAYDAGNTITTAGNTHVQITTSIAGGGFLVDGIAPAGTEGFVGFGAGTRLLALTGDAKGIAFNATEVASFKGGAATRIELDANDNVARTLLVKAENAGAGTADLTLDADDQITVGGTNTAAPLVQVDAGFNAEILTLSQMTGKSFGLFAGSGDPNGVVTATAGSLFVRDTGATASLYQNTTGGTVWTELGGGADQVVSDFIFQPNGAATKNVYTNFITLYNDLSASTAPKKRIILDDSSGPVVIPAGTFNLAGVTLTNGKVDANTSAPVTSMGWTPGTDMQNVSRMENIVAFAASGPGAGTPFSYTTDGYVVLDHCVFANINPLGDTVLSVSGGSTVYFHVHDTVFGMGAPSGPVVQCSGTDTLHFILRGTSIVGEDSLFGNPGDKVDSAELCPGGTFSTTQTNWTSTGPPPLFNPAPNLPAMVSPAGSVDFDSTGMTVAVGNDVQTAIEQLDAAAGGGGDLAATLALGNTSGGTDIELTTGDEIQGQTSVTLRSAANHNIDLISDGSGAVRIYTDNPADKIVFLQMGENQEVGLSHLPPGAMDPNEGILVLGPRNLTFPVPTPPATFPDQIFVSTPSIETTAAGAGSKSGMVQLRSGETSASGGGTPGASGDWLGGTGQVGGGTETSGDIELRSGNSTGDSGAVDLESGNAPSAGQTSGLVRLRSGDGDSTGNVEITTGSAALGTRGFVNIQAANILLDPDDTIDITETPPNFTAAAGFGRVFVADGTHPTAIQNSLYYVGTGGIKRLDAPSLDRHHINIPEAPNDTVLYKGWASYPCVLTKVKVLCATANTQGNLILSITNGAGTTVLSSNSININNAGFGGVLADDTIYNATLTGVVPDLIFDEDDRWSVSVLSNDVAMDAAGIYIDLTFEVS